MLTLGIAQTLRNKFRDQIRHGGSLPYEYDVALQSLEMVLSQQIQNAEKILQDSFPQRSGFRDLYEFNYSGISGKDVRWRLRHGKRMDAFWDGIFSNLSHCTGQSAIWSNRQKTG